MRSLRYRALRRALSWQIARSSLVQSFNTVPFRVCSTLP